MPAPGVPCCWLVRSKGRGSSPPCAMRSSTRAAAVVQASTQATMLMNAPKSMATPSGRDAGLAGHKMQWACGFAELAGFAAETQHLRVRAEHEEDAGQDGALNHCARNGAQRARVLRRQAWWRFQSPTKLNIDSTSAGPRAESETPRKPELVQVKMESEAHQHDAEHDDDETHGADFNPQHQLGGELYVAIGDECRPRRRRDQREQRGRDAMEGTAAKAGWRSRARRPQQKRRWQGRPATAPMPQRRQRNGGSVSAV